MYEVICLEGHLITNENEINPNDGVKWVGALIKNNENYEGIVFRTNDSNSNIDFAFTREINGNMQLFRLFHNQHFSPVEYRLNNVSGNNYDGPIVHCFIRKEMSCGRCSVKASYEMVPLHEYQALERYIDYMKSEFSEEERKFYEEKTLGEKASTVVFQKAS